MRDISEIRIQNETAVANRLMNARDTQRKLRSEYEKKFDAPAAGKGSAAGDGVQAFSKGELFPGIISVVERENGPTYVAQFKQLWSVCSSYAEAADWIRGLKASGAQAQMAA